MASSVNTAASLKSNSVTTSNAKLNITEWSPMLSNITMETVKYFYSENGLDADLKAITLEYTNGVLTSISDTWNYYSIGSAQSISKDEALNIAWSQAQKLTLSFTSDNNFTSEITPDLSNVTTVVNFSMQPKDNTTALYPYWHITYYFAKPYYQDYGIEVAIWGDTQQVISCHPLVMLDGSNLSGSSNPVTSTAQASANHGSLANTLLMACLIAGFIIVISTAGIAIRKRRNK